jgi:hypothetical protein
MDSSLHVSSPTLVCRLLELRAAALALAWTLIVTSHAAGVGLEIRVHAALPGLGPNSSSSWESIQP